MRRSYDFDRIFWIPVVAESVVGSLLSALIPNGVPAGSQRVFVLHSGR